MFWGSIGGEFGGLASVFHGSESTHHLCVIQVAPDSPISLARTIVSLHHPTYLLLILGKGKGG